MITMFKSMKDLPLLVRRGLAILLSLALLVPTSAASQPSFSPCVELVQTQLFAASAMSELSSFYPLIRWFCEIKSAKTRIRLFRQLFPSFGGGSTPKMAPEVTKLG